VELEKAKELSINLLNLKNEVDNTIVKLAIIEEWARRGSKYHRSEEQKCLRLTDIDGEIRHREKAQIYETFLLNLL
jgi:hypothetical protein